MVIVAKQYGHATYIIRLLEEASLSMQIAVRNAALASASDTQKRVGCLLTMFLNLSPYKKAAFIDAYKAAITLVGQGAVQTMEHNTYQPGQIPPRFDP